MSFIIFHTKSTFILERYSYVNSFSEAGLGRYLYLMTQQWKYFWMNCFWTIILGATSLNLLFLLSNLISENNWIISFCVCVVVGFFLHCCVKLMFKCSIFFIFIEVWLSIFPSDIHQVQFWLASKCPSVVLVCVPLLYLDALYAFHIQIKPFKFRCAIGVKSANYRSRVWIRQPWIGF